MAAGSTTDKIDELMAGPSLVPPFKTLEEMTERDYREQLDDFAAAGIGSIDELKRQFADHFYFGCEADDPTTAWAFDRHGYHRLNPIFSSDVGHFDVTDMTEVLEEAWELVEHGLIGEDDFRRVHLHQCRAPAHRAQSRVLQGHRGRGCGDQARAAGLSAGSWPPVRSRACGS